MTDKQVNIQREGGGEVANGHRPIMLAIAGDSGTGKTTITAGLVKALGAERMTSVGADDYHRYDREQRAERGITPLHPNCNYVDIISQHLRLLREGEPFSSRSISTPTAPSARRST